MRSSTSQGSSRARGDAFITGHILGNLALTARLRGQTERCAELAEESLSILRRSTNDGTLWLPLNELAHVAISQRRFSEARTLVLESVTTTRRAGNMSPWADSLEVGAELLLAEERVEDAVRLLGHIAAAREAGRFGAADGQKEARDQRLESLRDQLGDQRFGASWARGRASTSEEALGWIEQVG